MTIRDIVNFILDINLLFLGLGILGVIAFFWGLGVLVDIFESVHPHLPKWMKNFFKVTGLFGYYIALLALVFLFFLITYLTNYFFP